MSYNVRLKCGECGRTMRVDPHELKGGTYQIGPCEEAWLNVTYNYSRLFGRVLGEKGIRTIYGMTGAGSIPVLSAAIDALGDDVDPDYWNPTEGNARSALINLRALAEMAPTGVWDGN